MSGGSGARAAGGGGETVDFIYIERTGSSFTWELGMDLQATGNRLRAVSDRSSGIW